MAKDARADYNNDGSTNERDLELQKFDKNKDGKLDKDEQARADEADAKEMNRDRLESDLMNSEFSWAWKVIKSDPELTKLWNQAIKDGWTSARFQAKLMNSDWFQEHDGYQRTIIALEKTDPKTFQARLDGASAKIKDDLAQMGIDISQITDKRLADMGRRFLMMGFDQGQTAEAYKDWLGTNFVRMRGAGRNIAGDARSNQDSLNALLLANGFDPEKSQWKKYVSDTVNKVALGDMTLQDAQAFVREQAATLYPVFSDRIRQGQNVQDIAAAYFQIYADTLEMNPDEIKLTDPYMRAALQGSDETTGQPRAIGLWDFQKMLRKDERFQYTKQANQSADSLASSILSMFGFVG